jgi:hypothetical protein
MMWGVAPESPIELDVYLVEEGHVFSGFSLLTSSSFEGLIMFSRISFA